MDFIFEKANEISKRSAHLKAIKKLLPKSALNCFKNTHSLFIHIPIKFHWKYALRTQAYLKQSKQTKCYGFEIVLFDIFVYFRFALVRKYCQI